MIVSNTLITGLSGSVSLVDAAVVETEEQMTL
jgi:hypothetical protein